MSTTITTTSGTIPTTITDVASVPFTPGSGFTVDTGADGYVKADAIVSDVLSGDVATYSRLVSTLVTKKGKPTARQDDAVAQLVAGADLVNARQLVGELNADAYREITAAILMSAGYTRDDIAGRLLKADGSQMSKARVSQLGTVGRVIITTGMPVGYTLRDLRTVASSTAMKALSAVLAEDIPADEKAERVAAVVADGMRKRSEQSARKADASKPVAVAPSDETPTTTTTTAPAVQDVPETDEDSTPGEDAAPADIVVTDDETVGSDVDRFVKLLREAAALAPIIIAMDSEMSDAQRQAVSRAMGAFVGASGDIAF